MRIDWTRVVELHESGVGRAYSGSVLLVGRADDLLLVNATGTTAYSGTGAVVGPVTQDTVFDLASLTKALCTTSLFLLLVRKGVLDLDSRVAELVPGLRGTDKARITAGRLLTHSSGLPAWMPWGSTMDQEPGSDEARASVIDSIAAAPMEYRSGTRSVYSDVGFVLLGFMVEAAAGKPLDLAFDEMLADQLGLLGTFFVRVGGRDAPVPPVEPRLVAATEFCPTRSRMLQGEVNDDNAWFLGGVAGHAGLFGKAGDVWKITSALAKAWRGSGDTPFGPDTVRAAWDPANMPPGSTWVMGFDTPHPVVSSAGLRRPEGLVGHLGFTGTSFWIHPGSGTVVVLLSNRVHPTRENTRIRALRPRIHQAVWETLGLVQPGG